MDFALEYHTHWQFFELFYQKSKILHYQIELFNRQSRHLQNRHLIPKILRQIEQQTNW